MGATSYWKPKHMSTSAWLEHAPFAYWLVDAIRPRSIVELGTHTGFSYFVFCEAVVRLGLPTATFALDTWRGDDQAGFYDETIFNEVSRINNENYPAFSRLLRGYFDDNIGEIADGSVDLLHLDGRHGLEDIRHDFEAWLPKVSDCGVVLFHDIAERQEGFGVWEFWAEVSQRYPSFEFEHEHGLGVLGVGQAMPESMLRFFDAAAADPMGVRRTYEKLGAEITAQYWLENLRNENARLQAELAASAEASADRPSNPEHVRLLGQRDAEILGLRQQLAQLHASTSWKVTGPLRAVVTAAGNLRRR